MAGASQNKARGLGGRQPPRLYVHVFLGSRTAPHRGPRARLMFLRFARHRPLAARAALKHRSTWLNLSELTVCRPQDPFLFWGARTPRPRPPFLGTAAPQNPRSDRRTAPYEFIGLGAMDVTKTYKALWCGEIYVPKRYDCIGSRATFLFAYTIMGWDLNRPETFVVRLV